jgi:hypothetical protein
MGGGTGKEKHKVEADGILGDGVLHYPADIAKALSTPVENPWQTLDRIHQQREIQRQQERDNPQPKCACRAPVLTACAVVAPAI